MGPTADARPAALSLWRSVDAGALNLFGERLSVRYTAAISLTARSVAKYNHSSNVTDGKARLLT